MARLLWIDEIVIDQSNISEYSEQVSLMSLIYRRASRVIIWIGGEDEDIRLAFDFLPDLLEKIRSTKSSQDKWSTIIEIIGLPVVSSRTWNATSDIFARSWLRRLWVVQEAALASDAIVQCGALTLPWTDLAVVGRFQHGREDPEKAHDTVKFIDDLQSVARRGGRQHSLTDRPTFPVPTFSMH